MKALNLCFAVVIAFSLASLAFMPMPASAAKISSTKLKKRTYEYTWNQCQKKEVTLEGGVGFIECESVWTANCRADQWFPEVLGSCDAGFRLIKALPYRSPREQIWDATVFYRKIDGILRKIEPTTWLHTNWRRMRS